MSVICGILRFDGTSVGDVDLERQLGTVSRLNPDRSRAWRDGSIGLGHALMRVTEEDAFDNQPLIDGAAGLALVADLRLDNRDELAEALGIDNRTLAMLSDSAVLMRAYRKWGEDCAEHLLGDFAFAIWDAPARKLVLGRDHMGLRYIHYYRGPDFFVFATENKGVWAVADVPRRLDEFQIGTRLTLDISRTAGASLFQEIFGVLAGTVMTVPADGTMRSRRYWEPHADPVHLGRDETYYIATYRRLLSEAVQCRLRRATRPVGLFMSGGFDSAAIAALAGPVMSAKNRKLIAVASVMPEDYRGPLAHGRKWVELCRRDMPHLDVRYVTREGFGLLDNLEEDFLRRDGSSSPNRAANAAIYAALVESGTRVVMDGHGGDYTINPTATGWLAEQLLHGRLRKFLSEFRAYGRTLNRRYWALLKQEVIRPILPNWLLGPIDSIRSGLPLTGSVVPITRQFARSITAKGGSLHPRLPRTGGKRSLARRLAWFLAAQQATHNAGRSAAAAHGLDYAQPFHDKRLVEFALAIPTSLFVRNGSDRYMARQALGDLYPREFQSRQKGNDDRTPDFLAIFERDRPQMLEEIARMEKSARLRRMFDFAKMREMLSGRTTGRAAVSSEGRIRHAIRAFLMARFIEWHERANHP